MALWNFSNYDQQKNYFKNVYSGVEQGRVYSLNYIAAVTIIITDFGADLVFQICTFAPNISIRLKHDEFKFPVIKIKPLYAHNQCNYRPLSMPVAKKIHFEKMSS